MAILMPEKKQSTFSKLATPIGALAGGAIGTVIAPGAGTAMGASLGGALGNTAVGVAEKDAGKALGGAAEGAMNAGGMGAGGAMARRLATSVAPGPAPTPAPMSVSEQTKALGEGAQAISDLPPDQQQAYGPKIASAYNQSLRRDFRGMA